MMRFPVLLLALGVPLTAVAAERTPNFDARPGCVAGARSGVSERPNVDACMRSEEEAKNSILSQWNQFAAADKQRCVEKTHMGGPPSYVEVLTCLEIARDVRKLPKDRSDGLDAGLQR